MIFNHSKNILKLLFILSYVHRNNLPRFVFSFCEFLMLNLSNHICNSFIGYNCWCFFNNINYTYLWFLSFFSHIPVNFLTNFYNKSIKSLIYWILIHFIDFFRIKLTKFYSVTFFFHAFILIITFGSFNRFLFFVNWWNVLNRR